MFWLDENLILSNVLIRGESNFDDKYVEKSVQLVRGSSFRNDLLQNPYFNNFQKQKTNVENQNFLLIWWEQLAINFSMILKFRFEHIRS